MAAADRAPTPASSWSVRDVPLTVFGHDLLASCRPARGGGELLCLHLGDFERLGSLPVRIHSGCLTGEVLDSDRCDCAWQLRHAVDIIAAAGRGVIVYLQRQDGRGAGLAALLRSFELMDRGLTSAEAFAALGEPQDRRTYVEAVEVLCELGVRDVDAITNNPHKLDAMRRGGLRVRRRVPSVVPPSHPRAARYFRNKTGLGHLVDRKLHEYLR